MKKQAIILMIIRFPDMIFFLVLFFSSFVCFIADDDKNNWISKRISKRWKWLIGFCVIGIKEHCWKGQSVGDKHKLQVFILCVICFIWCCVTYKHILVLVFGYVMEKDTYIYHTLANDEKIHAVTWYLFIIFN